MKSKFKFLGILVLGCILLSMTGCAKTKSDVVIYTSLLDYRREFLAECLEKKFPSYNIRIEYLSTGNHAAKLLAEGTKTVCDITTDLEYGYMKKIDNAGLLADLSDYDHSIYVDDARKEMNILPKERNGNVIVVNTNLLSELKLPMPETYEDLLKKEYENLVSIPNPKASSSGYALVKSLVNSWGEDKAFEYFDQLMLNVQQCPSSGSGPINAVVQGEAVVGFGILSDAVRAINKGAPLEIKVFEEGAPYALYGQSIIKGKEENPIVVEVFNYLVNEFDYEDLERYSPEKIYKDIDFEVEGFPKNIKYADMSNNSPEEKERLLAKWQY